MLKEKINFESELFLKNLKILFDEKSFKNNYCMNIF